METERLTLYKTKMAEFIEAQADGQSDAFIDKLTDELDGIFYGGSREEIEAMLAMTEDDYPTKVRTEPEKKDSEPPRTFREIEEGFVQGLRLQVEAGQRRNRAGVAKKGKSKYTRKRKRR